MEIERKWLVTSLPELVGITPFRISQGYVMLDSNGAELRVRRRDENCTLTYKSGAGLVRTEIELRIEPTVFEQFWPLTVGRRIEKIRYPLRLTETNLLELDVFQGALEGLVVAEVEFSTTEAAGRFVPPAWLGTDVTGDSKYRNRELAR